MLARLRRLVGQGLRRAGLRRRHSAPPLPPPAGPLADYFFDTLAWGRSYQARAVFDMLTDCAAFAAGRPMLDAGAGHQRYKPFFERCLYVTQEHAAGIAHKGMHDIGYDLIGPLDERIPLKDESLAACICTSVIEHVRRPERMFAEVHRCLMPGGRFYINVPFAYCEHETPFDFQRPTRYGLAAWLKDAGFAEIDVRPTSSNTTCALFWLTWAVTEDGKRFGTTEEADAARAALDRLAPALEAWADGLVSEATTLPIGWIAVAGKTGFLPPPSFASKAEFLAACRLP
jgi:SAM-dependent methyltransferase